MYKETNMVNDNRRIKIEYPVYIEYWILDPTVPDVLEHEFAWITEGTITKFREMRCWELARSGEHFTELVFRRDIIYAGSDEF
jgi:hypothetical protein